MVTLLLILFRLIIVLSVVIFFMGLFKPEWLRFRQKQPDLLTTTAIALGLFMLGFTGAGEIHYVGTNRSELADRGKILSNADYSGQENAAHCDSGAKLGRTGASNDEKTSKGILYSVKTPLNYDPTIAHPLLMVYAPARKNRNESEAFMYLTQEATAAGFIVAYADHRNMVPEAISELAEIPGLIQQKWCVDAKRIFLTGHSDGGTIAMGIAFINGTKHIPAAIASSAVGINRDDLQERKCPAPLSVMVMHSSRDSLFPNYGKEAVEWWAACNGCKAAPAKSVIKSSQSFAKGNWVDFYQHELTEKSSTQSTESEQLPATIKVADGCVAYTGCKNDVKTWYCEGQGTHPEWPGKNKAIIDFLKSAKKN